MDKPPTRLADRRVWITMSLRNVGNVAEVMRGATGTKRDGGTCATRKLTGTNC